MRARYAGTRLGRQELDGVLLEDADGALWTSAALEALRGDAAAGRSSRVVVAVDPPVTGHAGSDECGIVVVGAVTEGPPRDWQAVVLEDASVSAATPTVWARGGDGGDGAPRRRAAGGGGQPGRRPRGRA